MSRIKVRQNADKIVYEFRIQRIKKKTGSIGYLSVPNQILMQFFLFLLLFIQRLALILFSFDSMNVLPIPMPFVFVSCIKQHIAATHTANDKSRGYKRKTSERTRESGMMRAKSHPIERNLSLATFIDDKFHFSRRSYVTRNA